MELFYATIIDTSYNEAIVGIFSTPEKTKAGCQSWASEWYQLEPPLVWTGESGFYKAVARRVTFEVNRVELDAVFSPPIIVT